MKAAIITCFESNEQRMSFVYDVFADCGYDVTAYTSDFSHIRKTKRDDVSPRFKAIVARPYSKNLSYGRIRSHMIFARDVFRRLEQDDVDLIWLMAPANSLIKEARIYKERHPSVKLIVDIIDMWPESLPVDIDKDLLPFRIWRNIRQKNLKCADLVVSECDMYQDALRRDYSGNIRTIYLAKDDSDIVNQVSCSDDQLSLCYIGSINHIIDIDRMVDVVSRTDGEVTMHVIGEGESSDEMLEKMSSVARVIYHGAVRDEKKKTEIFDMCHAGMNIYREGLYIGLTTKCLDYFQNGLPIINNIKGDTWKMVEEYGAGINIDDDSTVSARELIDMRRNNANVYRLFNDRFTRRSFDSAVKDVLQEVLK